MAFTVSNATAPLNILGAIARPFSAVMNFLIQIAEANPRMKEVQKLNETTDEQLAARGTTRVDEVNRIFNGRFYL